MTRMIVFVVFESVIPFACGPTWIFSIERTSITAFASGGEVNVRVVPLTE